MDRHDPAYQRRAIFQGLAPFLKRNDLFQALWQWQEKYANQNEPAVNHFVQTICDSYQLTGQRAEVYDRLVQALQKDMDELGPDPLAEMLQHRKHNSKPANNIPPATTVFCQVLTEFFANIAYESIDLANRCKSYLANNLSQVVKDNEADAMVSWLLYPKMTLSRSLEAKSMRGMVHVSYIGACEYIGPVKADRYLSEAIKKAEGLKEAAYFPPRQLL